MADLRLDRALAITHHLLCLIPRCPDGVGPELMECSASPPSGSLASSSVRGLIRVSNHLAGTPNPSRLRNHAAMRARRRLCSSNKWIWSRQYQPSPPRSLGTLAYTLLAQPAQLSVKSQ